MKTDVLARQQFLREYAVIRRAEGRGSDDSLYYRALPFKDLSGRSTAMWKMREASYRYFLKHVLAPLERKAQRRLDVLDLGAGNCWLSYRLAVRGHRVLAADIFNDKFDGLGAARNYETNFATVEADFDNLPVACKSFDLAIYNSSFHYSTDYARTLLEARRCLRSNGLVVILDTPIYKRKEHGDRMAEERHRYFLARYGFRSDAMPSLEFLDEAALAKLSKDVQITWRRFRPWYGWKWHVRPLKARLRNQRPPSRFWILTGRFNEP